jgi:streptogramin lyase
VELGLFKARIARWALPLLAALTFVAVGRSGDSAAQTPGPVVDQGIVATWYRGQVELTGSGFGVPSESSYILFEFGSRQKHLSSSAPEVVQWTDERIVFSLPIEVQSGKLAVAAAGQLAGPVDFLVYRYQATDIQVNKLPLALALGASGELWLNSEYHRDLKRFAPGSQVSYEAIPVPQAEGGIFALNVLGDNRTSVSALGEDIVVDEEGDVWFTEGGGFLYEGEHLNSSRIVQYDPVAETFACFNSPIDNAQVVGVLVDEDRDLVWYSEGGPAGNAISAFNPATTGSDCTFDPYSGAVRAPVCSENAPIVGCHRRYHLPRPGAFPAHLTEDADGRIWFTELFGNRVTSLNPGTGAFADILLPGPDIPNIANSMGPWEIETAPNGTLWVTAYLDAKVLRIRTDQIEQCNVLLPSGENPCVEELRSSAMDGATNLHSLAAGQDSLVWFGVEFNEDGVGLSDRADIGFVSIAHNDQIVVLPSIKGMQTAAGIVQDPSTGDVWFAEFASRRIYRLREVGAGDVDDDGVVDASDNCVVDVNASQQDSNGDGLGDACDPNDVDRDGCQNVREQGSNPLEGGLRNPNLYWDFYDIPTGGGGTRDRQISGLDLFAIIARFGTSDAAGNAAVNRDTDPLSAVPASGYHPAFDRSRPLFVAPWQSQAADGSINGTDIFALLGQFGHQC